MESMVESAYKLSGYDLDESALEALSKLSSDQQDACISKFESVMQSGEIQESPSETLRSICVPITLGIDEKAQTMLEGLPKVVQKELLAHLRQSPGVQNPSAWIIKSVVNAQKDGGRRMHYQSMAVSTDLDLSPDELGVDERAQEKLQELPKPVQAALLANLKKKPDVRNPSAWIINAVISAKQDGIMSYHNMSARTNADLDPNTLGVDARAQTMLEQLPKPIQTELLAQLARSPDVQNPSAWIAKSVVAAKQAANGKKHNPFSGMQRVNLQMNAAELGVDEEAQYKLQEMPEPIRAELLAQLARLPDVQNPSAWIIQAVTKAKQEFRPVTQKEKTAVLPVLGLAMLAGLQLPSGKGLMPNPAATLGLDERAQQKLQELPNQKQAELLFWLTQSDVHNPSAWMIKAVIQAQQKGGDSGKGMGNTSMGFGKGGPLVKGFGKASSGSTGKYGYSPMS
jgi:phage-related protein